MTTQILDTVLHRNEVHDLVATAGEGLFDPATHQLPVVMASTASWRGYVCAYVVTENQLRLDQLEAKIGRYNDDDMFVAVAAPALSGRPGKPATYPPFNTVYEHLALPVHFTGQLLVCAGRVDAVVSRLGYAPAWVYERARVLRFSAGALAGEDDLSDAMAAMRAQYDDRGTFQPVAALERPELAWVARSFMQQL
jgi:hypothetical protein